MTESLALKDYTNMIEVTRDRLRGYIERGGKGTNRKVAKAIGYTEGAVSGFVNASYGGRMDQMAIAVERFHQLEEQRRENVVHAPSYVETATAREILAVIQYAHEQVDIGLAVGPAGIGKTFALREYVSKHPSSIMITADVTIAGKKAFLEEVAETLGLNTYGDSRKLRNQIKDKLEGSGRLLLIDESQHLSLKALEMVRFIYDKCGIGIVLLGNERVFSNMTGPKSAPFAQFFSRVGICRHLSGKVSMDDVRKIVCQDIEVSPECLEYLHQQANQAGGLRMMVKLFILAWRIANGNGKLLTLDALRAASRFLLSRGA